MELFFAYGVFNTVFPLIVGVLFVLAGRSLLAGNIVKKVIKIILIAFGDVCLLYALACAVHFGFF